MSRGLQCIFCDHVFFIGDEDAIVVCPACGTELLDESYVREVDSSSALGESTLPQALDAPPTQALDAMPTQALDATPTLALEATPTQEADMSSAAAAEFSSMQRVDTQPTLEVDFGSMSLGDVDTSEGEPRSEPKDLPQEEVSSFFSEDEVTLSRNRDLEALAAASGEDVTVRRRWRCPSCSAEFPGSRPHHCPACGADVDGLPDGS